MQLLNPLLLPLLLTAPLHISLVMQQCDTKAFVHQCLTLTVVVPGTVAMTVGGMHSVTAAEAVTMPWTELLMLAGEV